MAPPDSATPTAENVAERIGHCGAASGFFSVLGAALSIADERRPGSYWLRDRADGPRRATVSSAGIGGDALSVTLEESPPAIKPDSPSILDETILALTGDSREELVNRIRDVRSLATNQPNLAFAARIFREFPPRPRHPHALSIVIGPESPLGDFLAQAESAGEIEHARARAGYLL